MFPLLFLFVWLTNFSFASKQMEYLAKPTAVCQQKKHVKDLCENIKNYQFAKAACQ